MVEKLSSLEERVAEAEKVLWPYQQNTLERMVKDKRHLVYLDMGMGKSLTTLLSVIKQRAFPCVIVCSKSAMYVMEQELQNWFGLEAVVYHGKPKKRDEQWKQFVTEGREFIITNYSLVDEIGARAGIEGLKASGKKASLNPPPGTKYKFGALVADEIQLGGLFNHKTKTYKVFNYLAKSIPVMYLLTGTPYRRGVIDLYGPLSLVDPKRFDSYWKFVGRYCRTIDTGFGKSIERTPKNVEQFRAMIREYATILKKEDYLKDLPRKIRSTIPIDMLPEQAKVYNELTKELFAETENGDLIITPGILSLSVRQRQLLVCPQELGLNTRGAAVEAMLEMSEDLVAERRPFVIFTPFKKAVPWIQEALRDKYGAIKIHTITGGLTAEEFGNQWMSFQEGKGARVLICVIKSGASFHATAADTAFFLGYEYDFNQNAQAEDRLYRIGQTKTVNCYYFLHRGTVEDDIRQILNDKKFSADLVLSEEEIYRKMLAKREV